ncbi:hypothetical protein OSB04_021599 [Centaurea solstitialis]|uniref:Serine aminopeptidase S33 domain-containing protein n=1 Tax=Centaurea solstitialis TaxID=347529 RepID=A0AA38T5T8_9ASTR|nr:hypothetical protein OSB04_021599 [Centaurea solstitialis]
MLTSTTISASFSSSMGIFKTSNWRLRASMEVFPSFLPKEVDKIKDPFARKLASRIQRLPVELTSSNDCIMSSCVKPIIETSANPLVLLHGFDRYTTIDFKYVQFNFLGMFTHFSEVAISREREILALLEPILLFIYVVEYFFSFSSSCLEWRYTLPLLEQAGFETWAIDILGWGFSNLEKLPLCNVDSKRDHLYQFWKSYIGRPMLLVGPSLGAAVAIDFAVNHPEAVDKLILIDASVYAEGTGNLSKLPKFVAYAGVMQKTLIIWGEDDQIIDSKLAVQLHCELPNAIIRQIPACGHIPHVEKPDAVMKLIKDFIMTKSTVPLVRKQEEKELVRQLE